MSLGIHRKHFLTAADRVRIQKGIEQEERDNFITIELDPTQNPFGQYGVLKVDQDTNFDSADASYDFPMLKATPGTEFNFTSDDDFTIHWWMKPDPDRTTPSGNFSFKLDDYGTVADWAEGSAGTLYHPFNDEPEFGFNGYYFTLDYRLGTLPYESIFFASKTPGQETTDIHYYSNRHEVFDSAGPNNFVDDWNHCALVHKAGVGLSFYLNGTRLIGPVNIEIKRCVRSYGLHLLGTGSPGAWFREGLDDSSGTSPLTTVRPVDLGYPFTEDFEGLNHDDWHLGPFQIKRTAIFDPSDATITVPTTEPTSDDDTVLLLLFRYNTTDTIEDVVSLPSTTRTQKTITQYNVDVDTAYELATPQPARFFNETHSRISWSNFRPWFEPNSAGEPGFFQDDPLFRSYLSARYFSQYLDSSGDAFEYPYALVTPAQEFNWDHNDPWTIEFHTIGWNSRTWFGFTCAERGTYNGWAFAITTDRFYFFSNDPTNSYSRRIGIVNQESAGSPNDFGDMGGEYTGTVEDSFGETLKFDSAGQETPILNHFAIVNEPGTGLSLYFNGRRVFGPVSIHITKPATAQDLYWGSNYRLYVDSLNEDSAGDEFSEQVDYSFPFWDGASTTERKNGFCASLENNIDFDEVRISKVARYTGDLYEVPMVRHRNDADTLLLCRGQMDDSAGIIGTAPTILYEVSIDDDNHPF